MISRFLLYEKPYYHQKIRAVEGADVVRKSRYPQQDFFAERDRFLL